MQINMREDLIAEDLSVPASKTFSNYDNLDEPIIYISAMELEGAVYGEDPCHPDEHPFCYLRLKDGRSLYFMSVDLDFRKPTAEELYEKLQSLGLDFDVVEIFEGLRTLQFEVTEGEIK